jgi:hypothetical protein
MCSVRHDKYGYAGKKVEAAELLDYYFDTPPAGSWLKLEIIITKQAKKRIPALNPTTDSDFNIECAPAGAKLQDRTQNVPTVGDEEE